MADSLTLDEVRKARDKWVADLRDNLAVKQKEIVECDARGKLLRQQRDEIAEELRRTTPRAPRKRGGTEKAAKKQKSPAPAGQAPTEAAAPPEDEASRDSGALREEAHRG